MNNLQWIIQEHDPIFVFFPDGWVVGWGGGWGGWLWSFWGVKTPLTPSTFITERNKWWNKSYPKSTRWFFSTTCTRMFIVQAEIEGLGNSGLWFKLHKFSRSAKRGEGDGGSYPVDKHRGKFQNRPCFPGTFVSILSQGIDVAVDIKLLRKHWHTQTMLWI